LQPLAFFQVSNFQMIRSTFWSSRFGLPGIIDILPWVTNNQGSDTRRRTGIVLLNLIGQYEVNTSAFESLQLMLTDFSHSWEPTSFLLTKVHIMLRVWRSVTALTFFTGSLAFGPRTLLAWENRKLDKKYDSNENGVINQPGAEARESEGELWTDI